MNPRQLETILDKHNVADVDRPAFRSLVDFGTRPDATYRKRLRSGRLKAALDDALAMLSEGLEHVFPQHA